MKIACLEITLKADYVKSLKEKRMIVRSIKAKVRQKFNVSVSEIDKMDRHRTIVLGFTAGSTSTSQLQSTMDQLVNFIESNYDVSIEDIKQDIF